jgi:hypothetical protein
MNPRKKNPLGATKGLFEAQLNLNCNAYLTHSKPFLGVL